MTFSTDENNITRRCPGECQFDCLFSVHFDRVGLSFGRLFNPRHMPDLHGVARTNFCDIGVTFDARTKRAVVVSAIDNLVKGAAGQAIQNMNLMLGYAETEGLL